MLQEYTVQKRIRPLSIPNPRQLTTVASDKDLEETMQSILLLAGVLSLVESQDPAQDFIPHCVDGQAAAK